MRDEQAGRRAGGQVGRADGQTVRLMTIEDGATAPTVGKVGGAAGARREGLPGEVGPPGGEWRRGGTARGRQRRGTGVLG